MMVMNHDPENHILSLKAIEGAKRRGENGGGGTHSYRQYKWGDVAHAITSHFAKDATNHVHPAGNREERLIIQGFDDYILEDGKVRLYLCSSCADIFGVPHQDTPTAIGTCFVEGCSNDALWETYETPQIRALVDTTRPDYNVTPQLPINGLTVAELFCGGGLMATGLQAAGYNITFANDFDKRATEAYAYNIGDHVICGDITSESVQAQIPNTDIIAGGPPCQDYSIAGEGAGEDGERGKLVWTYLKIIEDKQPKAFIFENVKGLLSKNHRATFDELLSQFDAIGYTVSWQLINAWDYGVAQKRERVFIVGIRKDLGITFQFPTPSPAEYRTQVLRDVIGDLPEPKEQDCGRFWTPGREYTYEQANRVQTMESPCNTIPAHHNSGQPIHPLQAPRRFTVRECLRIQSVPDTYTLPDSISLSAQYRIVGNGVASRVAYLLGIALATQLQEGKTK